MQLIKINFEKGYLDYIFTETNFKNVLKIIDVILGSEHITYKF